MDMEYDPQTLFLNLTWAGVSFNSGEDIQFRTTHTLENLDRPFAIRPGIVVPPGEYTTHNWHLSGSTAGFRPISATLAVSGGSFWSGTRQTIESGLTVRPLPGFDVGATWEHNAVDLAEGAFTADLFQLNTGWHLNPLTSLTGSLQYDNLSELVGLYARLRWILRPGSDLYLVYAHNWINELDRIQTLDRNGATKLTYTHRF